MQEACLLAYSVYPWLLLLYSSLHTYQRSRIVSNTTKEHNAVLSKVIVKGTTFHFLLALLSVPSFLPSTPLKCRYYEKAATASKAKQQRHPLHSLVGGKRCSSLLLLPPFSLYCLTHRNFHAAATIFAVAFILGK